jgi:hypothetical protein
VNAGDERNMHRAIAMNLRTESLLERGISANRDVEG